MAMSMSMTVTVVVTAATRVGRGVIMRMRVVSMGVVGMFMHKRLRGGVKRARDLKVLTLDVNLALADISQSIEQNQWEKLPKFAEDKAH